MYEGMVLFEITGEAPGVNFVIVNLLAYIVNKQTSLRFFYSQSKVTVDEILF